MQEIKEHSRIEENGRDDFSFACLNPDASPISADDAFVNGQIRPVFPMFDTRILTEHGFDAKETETTEDRSTVSPEIYCDWSPPQPPPPPRSSAAPELGKKSYSTGFSKLWRFGDKIRRSSSDGKEKFVFLRSGSSGSAKGGSGGENNGKVKAKGEKRETSSYYNHERLYARNRAQNEVNKRKSYLPYRSNLMGFFTSPNGLNRNF